MKAERKLKNALRGVPQISTFFGKRKDAPEDVASPSAPAAVPIAVTSSLPIVVYSSLENTTASCESIQIRCEKLRRDIELLYNTSDTRVHQAWLIERRLVLCRPPTDMLDANEFLSKNRVSILISCDRMMRPELASLGSDTRVLNLCIDRKLNIKKSKLVQLCALIKTLAQWMDAAPDEAIALCDYSGSAGASFVAIAMLVFIYKCAVLDASVAVTRLWGKCLERSGSTLKVRLMPSSESMRKAADAIAPTLLQTNVVTGEDKLAAIVLLEKIPAEFSVAIPAKPVYTRPSSKPVVDDTQKSSARQYYTNYDCTGDGDWDSGAAVARVKRRRINDDGDDNFDDDEDGSDNY